MKIMKLTALLIVYIPFQIFHISATVIEKRKRNNVSFSKSEKKRENHLAGRKNITEAIPYQEIHATMYGESDSDVYKSWPELETKKPLELTEICNKFLMCTGHQELVKGDDSTLEEKTLKYFIPNSEVLRKPDGIVTYQNAYKSRQVLMLCCRISVQKVRRFLKGAYEYAAFLALPIRGSPSIFTIVGACRTDFLELHKEQKFEHPVQAVSYTNLETIRKAAPYQRIHVNMHMNDLKAYGRWPEVEKLQQTQLDLLCFKYLQCLGYESDIVEGWTHTVSKMLKYYIVDERRQGSSEQTSTSYRRYHVDRLVRVLKCKTGCRFHHFVKGSDGYSAFYVEPTTTHYDFFTIVDACRTDNLNVREITVNSIMNKNDIAANESHFKCKEEKYMFENVERIDKMRESHSENDSETTISDDNIYRRK